MTFFSSSASSAKPVFSTSQGLAIQGQNCPEILPMTGFEDEEQQGKGSQTSFEKTRGGFSAAGSMRAIGKVRPSQHALLERLVKQRQMTSHLDIEIALASDDLKFDNTDWVSLYADLGNSRVSDCGRMLAFRAITFQGALIWYVFSEGRRRGYHARATDPFAAFDEAERALEQRREVKAAWSIVEDFARQLRWGRQTCGVSLEDAHNSALCADGIEAFMRRMGMARFHTISGRIAGWLMLIEPQIGFVLYETMRRQSTQSHRTHESSPVRAAVTDLETTTRAK